MIVVPQISSMCHRPELEVLKVNQKERNVYGHYKISST
jgi:hypothetical protein